MRALMDLVHKITVSQVSGAEPDAPGEDERAALADFAARLSAGKLHRLWQLLLKGHEEVRSAPDPLVSLQMALLRVLHAADMPDPGKLARRIEQIASQPAAPVSAPSGETAGAPVAQAAASPDWAELVEDVDRAGHMHVAEMMRSRMRLVELAPERLIFQQADNYPDDPAGDVKEALFKLTGKRWAVERGTGPAQPTLREQAEAAAKATRDATLSDPLVKAAFDAFPEAELIETPPNAEEASPPRSAQGGPWN